MEPQTSEWAPTGFPMRILLRPLLVPAMLATDGSGRVLLIVDSESSEPDQVLGLWHEVVHVLLLAVGKSRHDETKVDEIAERLAVAVPDILQVCGLRQACRLPPGAAEVDSRAA